ncbi:MAG: Phosphoribosyl-AMP cyclohydrolase [Candidatus Taylorbacteria bacterium]|nr:Phosphoribosyl-AMP cyclohydrolase [Candidatus Taylorbacteria bacterium]
METIDFKKRGGLVPVIAQDSQTRAVLMLAYADDAALQQTIETGIATYYSTSRNELWVKGATSGNTQIIREIYADCDSDALIYVVEQNGIGACHTGSATCFFNKIS